MVIVGNGGGDISVEEAVLFAFDDHAIPFIAGLKLDLLPGKSPGITNPIVLGRGPRGRPTI